jgi:hypothetical protein
MSEQRDRLIQLLGAAVLGYGKDTVLDVLASFTASCCQRWNVSLDSYTERLRKVWGEPSCKS